MMSATIMFLCILVGMMLAVKALTLQELQEKVSKIDKIEQNVEWLVKEFNYWKDQKINISEELINEKFDTVDNLEMKVNNLTSIANQLNQQVTDSQMEIARLQNLLDYGGQHVQTYPLNDTLQLRDQDELRLQFLGTRKAWLGCPFGICDLRICPSLYNRHNEFDACGGEVFQIIGEGAQGSAIKSGQRMRLRYRNWNNSWIGCPYSNRCEIRSCPGTAAQGRNFRNNRCSGEIFIIYARGRTNGQTIYNGDLVMLYAVNADRYVSIQGQKNGDYTSLNFCPGIAPPPYLSYGMCIKNVARVYRKP